MIELIKDSLIHYSMLKVYVRQCMIVKKFHEIISFKQSKRLAKYKSFNTQKQNKAKKEFEKDFYEINNIAFCGKMLENINNR